MRIAIVSDIHDNLTALLAVINDLRETSPDLILHGGDLVGGGASPCEVVDCIRSLGWPGVLGNTDESIGRPESLEEFAAQSQAPAAVWNAVREMNAFTRDALGAERIGWLGELPRMLKHSSVALVHASAESVWRSPLANATRAELESTYAQLGEPIVVYGHIHQSFIRQLAGLTAINSGSVSQSFDCDPRAAYVLIDDGVSAIRRVEYDVEREARAITASGIPHSDWMIQTLRAARPQLPANR